MWLVYIGERAVRWQEVFSSNWNLTGGIHLQDTSRSKHRKQSKRYKVKLLRRTQAVTGVRWFVWSILCAHAATDRVKLDSKSFKDTCKSGNFSKWNTSIDNAITFVYVIFISFEYESARRKKTNKQTKHTRTHTNTQLKYIIALECYNENEYVYFYIFILQNNY